MTTRKTPKHYGKLGGPHPDKRRAQEPIDDDFVVYFNECPACHMNNYEHDSFMGTMGNTEHHRCRYCGANFTRTAE